MWRYRSWGSAPVATAYAGFVLVGVSAGVGGVLLPAQMADYGVSRATIGITFFTFSAGFMLSGAAVGPLVQRLGTRTALLLGVGCFVAAAGVTALRPPLTALFAVQVIAGFGSGTIESVLNTVLSELPGATSLLNRLHAFFGVGALAGPALAAWMLGFTRWTGVWLMLAVAALPLAAAVAEAFPRRTGGPAPGRGPRREATPGGGQRRAAAPGRGLLAEALRTPAVALASAFLAVYVGLEMSVGNWAFSLLVDGRGVRELLAGAAVSGYWLGLTLGRFLISPIAARLGLADTAMSVWCLAGVACATTALWAAPGAWPAGAAMVLLGFFLGPLFPTAMAVVPRLTTARLVATAIGVMNGVSVLGGSLLPWLAGALTQAAGLWLLPPYALLLAVVQLVIWRSVARRAAPEATRRPTGLEVG